MAKTKKVTTTDTPTKELFTLQPPLPYQLRYIAFTDETTKTEIVNQALMQYIAAWEKKNGPIPTK